MVIGNETALRSCRFLSEDHFAQLYEAFIEAYSDYVISFALTEEQFLNHINLNAVDLSQTVGCVENGKLIGFSLNGFGDWDGEKTVYDAGTGVLPSHRRRGVSNEMFDFMLPVFKENGTNQVLLEVVTQNSGALNLYKKLNFQPVRELALLQCDKGWSCFRELPADIVIREIADPDWNLLTSFWDGKPSWQNSVEAVKRSRRMKRVIGAYSLEECVGYIVFSSKFGSVAQIAVDPEHRHRGIGSALVAAMQTETAEGFSMQVINIDKSLTGAMDFFLKCGLYERLSQFEMIKRM